MSKTPAQRTSSPTAVVKKPAVKAAAAAPAKKPAAKTASPATAAKPAAKTAAAPAKAAAHKTPAAPVAAAPSPAAAPKPAPAAVVPSRAMNAPVVDSKPARKVDPKLANAWKTKAGSQLTEDELLAMPDSEYMNEKQLEFFRSRLMQQKEDLLANAGETTEHLREDTSIVPDPADRATIEEEHALELRTRDRERKLLKKISQSIARIDSGDYGYCDETGEPIGLGRLLARPTATLSLEAQQRREMKQKMFGD
ncbi:RNA polymerase-binding protein DksA [Caldimonas sp. KR1-144]|uniref:RNA polymerase-binding protein DksA n=1 Tax=Caldimonas sp. KR1-144 TaxID=3400911 RepID=UPI003C031D66